MRYKKGSIPEPSKGVDYTTEKDAVVPNQSMSLHEILTRFTRGEALAVGKPTFGDSKDDNEIPDIDFEKLPDLDITEKKEMIEGFKDTAKRYERQEKRKAEAKAKKEAEDKAKAEEERIQKAIAEGIAKGNSGRSA